MFDPNSYPTAPASNPMAGIQQIMMARLLQQQPQQQPQTPPLPTDNPSLMSVQQPYPNNMGQPIPSMQPNPQSQLSQQAAGMLGGQ